MNIPVQIISGICSVTRESGFSEVNVIGGNRIRNIGRMVPNIILLKDKRYKQHQQCNKKD
ncbi:MAG: hypothetical protein AAE977_07185 [Thermoplasmataceae archaeon]